MRIQDLATATSLLFLVLITGCSAMHGDPDHPKKNPHPVKRYEVVVTTNAPGPWNSIKGDVAYKITNVNCLPQDSFTGGRNVPNNVNDVELTRVDEKTWRGYFYKDAFRDEDYFGLGSCHWDVTSVGAAPVFQGINFSWSEVLEDLLHKGRQTRYFKNSAYGDISLVKYGAQDYSSTDNGVIEHPDDYFQVSIVVKEVTP